MMPSPTITLPLDPALPRRWRVTASDIFARDDDFDGLTLTLELLSAAEARAVVEALMDIMDRSET